jgi:hypothetical protein
MSFIKDNYIITKKEYQFLSNLKLTPCQQELLLHCIKSSTRSLRETPKAEGYFPLPSLTIQSQYTTSYLKEVVNPLIELGYLARNNYFNIDKNICMHYKATMHILQQFNSVNTDYLYELDKLSWVNSKSGRKSIKKPKQGYYDESRNLYPPLIVKALKAIGRSKFNIKDLVSYLSNQEESLSKSNDVSCLLSLFNKEAVYNPLTSELEYHAVYTPKFAGRIYELDGGTQTMSRLSRHILMSNTPNFYNYDLKSSQVYSLMELFEEANINIDWLTNYLAQPKQVFADRCGITVDTWKTCLMALIMGAELPSNKQMEYSSVAANKAIFNAIREQCDSLEETIPKVLAFIKEVEELNIQLNTWHDYLLNVKVPREQLCSNGVIAVTNKTGKAFILSEYIDIKKRKYINTAKLKRQLAAFYLQGHEACFIFYIQYLSEHYKYKVIGNYHDGVTTLNPIPQEAIEDAKFFSGNKYAHLEIKPII